MNRAARETQALECELRALETVPIPEPATLTAAWRMGARYALAWTIHRRGAEMGPAEAAETIAALAPTWSEPASAEDAATFMGRKGYQGAGPDAATERADLEPTTKPEGA